MKKILYVILLFVFLGFGTWVWADDITIPVNSTCRYDSDEIIAVDVGTVTYFTVPTNAVEAHVQITSGQTITWSFDGFGKAGLTPFYPTLGTDDYLHLQSKDLLNKFKATMDTNKGSGASIYVIYLRR